jgi:hypothetical protein
MTMIACYRYGNYMSESWLSGTKICIFCCFCLGGTPGLLAELVFEKVPPLTVEQAPAYPQNLARYYLGAKVEAMPESIPIQDLQLSSKWEDTNKSEVALLCNDPTVGYALSTGSTTLLVSFAKIETIDSISFLNRGAKGNVRIAISSAKLPADSPQWHDIVQQDLSTDAVRAKMGPSEAKYVRFTFDVTEPGQIAGFGIYCTATVSDFTMARPRKVSVQEKPDNFALISYSLTDLHARARSLYVTSGEDLKQANNMIDDQAETSFTFAATDAAPAVIIDLGKVTTLRRISALYSPQRSGRMDFFVLQSLPGLHLNVQAGAGAAKSAKNAGLSSAGNPPQTLSFDDSAATDLKLVGSVVDDGRGRAAINFSETTGRYILVKWNPAAQSETGFSIAEIAAFGEKRPATLMAAATGAEGKEIAAEERSFGEGKEFKGFKQMAAGKEIPEEAPPAEGPPPSLPAPPPFTFVPEIVPVSPE